jgi:hypothetical protein
MKMAAEIIKVYKERFPAARLIGKRYTDADRINGSFSAKWDEWFENKWFHIMIGEDLSVMPGDYGSYLGFCRVINGKFEYWIGTVFPLNTPVPEGFDYDDIDEIDIATCWIYGNEKSGELFGCEAHNMCVTEIVKHNYIPNKNHLSIERYTCPRFTTPDEKGNVILDYCIAIERTV